LAKQSLDLLSTPLYDLGQLLAKYRPLVSGEDFLLKVCDALLAETGVIVAKAPGCMTSGDDVGTSTAKVKMIYAEIMAKKRTPQGVACIQWRKHFLSGALWLSLSG
jgi:hypothetical protein